MASECIFCSIVAGTIPCHRVAESEHALAFLDINPLSSGHTLVIPKQHAVKVHELPDSVMADVGVLLAKVSRAVAAENYNVLQNNGRDAGQVVMHAHFHIIPRSSNDGLKLMWNAKETNHTELAKVAEELRGRL
jgi:diadenosine tetraphosphate (Ap4A) HIT family hydrolase